MKLKSKYICITSIISVALFQAPINVFAGEVRLKETEATSLLDFLNNIKNYLLGFVGALAVLMIIYGGFQYITAAGNTAKAESAKKTLTYSIFGLLFILFAQVVIYLLTSGLGELFGTNEAQILK